VDISHEIAESVDQSMPHLPRERIPMAAVKSSVKQVRYVMGAMTAVFFSTCSGS
jgi:hypothetical protein